MPVTDELNKKIAEYLPSYVTDVMERFFAAGEEIYIVGGSLRDILRDTRPHDFDLATSALPERTLALFSDMRVIETGLKHGTVTVMSEGNPLEITTFRIDGSYTDSRHPDAVSFTRNIREDLSRRDFTVNAMAFSPRNGLIDPFGGMEDILARRIRAVGDPKKRFSEDALRIMRAFRFSAQLDFEIDPDTLRGAVETKEGLERIARERIASELIRLISSREPSKSLRLMTETGILPLVTGGYIPEEGLIENIGRMPREDHARLGFLLIGAGQDRARTVLNSLRCSNKQIKGALAVVRGSARIVDTPASARRFIAECGAYAPEAAMASVILGNTREEHLAYVTENRSPCVLSDLAVTGRELLTIGIGGKDVGRVLDALLEEVIERPELNERDTLVSMAKKLKGTITGKAE